MFLPSINEHQLRFSKKLFAVAAGVLMTTIAAGSSSADDLPNSVRTLGGHDLALVTDLWRSQFNAGDAVDEESALNEAQAADSRMSASGEHSLISPPVAAADEIRRNSSTDELLAALNSSDIVMVEEMPLNNIDVSSGVSGQPQGLSEWEQAASGATAGGAGINTKEGPSAVTGVVAVVSLIVILGAYFKGRG